jgi:hypothetical protein
VLNNAFPANMNLLGDEYALLKADQKIKVAPFSYAIS